MCGELFSCCRSVIGGAGSSKQGAHPPTSSVLHLASSSDSCLRLGGSKGNSCGIRKEDEREVGDTDRWCPENSGP